MERNSHLHLVEKPAQAPRQTTPQPSARDGPYRAQVLALKLKCDPYQYFQNRDWLEKEARQHGDDYLKRKAEIESDYRAFHSDPAFIEALKALDRGRTYRISVYEMEVLRLVEMRIAKDAVGKTLDQRHITDPEERERYENQLQKAEQRHRADEERIRDLRARVQQLEAALLRVSTRISEIISRCSDIDQT